MALLGSKKVKTTVVTVDGVEHVIDFANGIANVEKKVKKRLLRLSPELYFDPDNAGEAPGFSNDLEAVQYYISKLKTPGNAARLCAMLKGEYESLQGDLLSGKYSEKTEVRKVEEKKEEKVSDEDLENIVGAGDSIKVKKKKHKV